MKPDTHGNTFAEAKTFVRWCVKKKYLKAKPFGSLEPQGKRRRGKVQLLPQEARVFIACALKKSAAGDDGAFASASALTLSRLNWVMRASPPPTGTTPNQSK